MCWLANRTRLRSHLLATVVRVPAIRLLGTHCLRTYFKSLLKSINSCLPPPPNKTKRLLENLPHRTRLWQPLQPCGKVLFFYTPAPSRVLFCFFQLDWAGQGAGEGVMTHYSYYLVFLSLIASGEALHFSI